MGRPAGGYRLADGTRVPGVTTIISRFKESGGLVHWAWQLGVDGKDYRRERDKAGDLGHLAHELIEARIHKREPWLTTDDPAQLESAENALAAFDSWASATHLEIVATEETLISETHRVGGTLDGLGRVNGELHLLDWKSSARIYSDYLVQVAAYTYLWEEAHPDEERIAGVHLVRVGKEFADVHHHHWPRPVMDLGWEAFLKMRALYEIDKRLKRAVGA